MKWTIQSLPDQTGRTAIVTGANAGIGFETARALARKGATVILGCRNEDRGRAAVDRIMQAVPAGAGSAELEQLDLSQLDSVRGFADRIAERLDRIDLLINNAGVMVPPFGRTTDGFELQIGVNYLGHFALTGRLMPLLAQTAGSRVVTLSSLAHRTGRIDFETFTGDKPYRAWREYQQSKLACLMFALELQRRLAHNGAEVISVAAHPGWTKTDLQRHSSLFDLLSPVFAMSAEQGALPTLYAAAAPAVRGGDYFGPGGWAEVRGYPGPAKIAARARDEAVSRRLWDVAEESTAVRQWA